MEKIILQDFISSIDSTAPTPGGGSVSAVVGVLGASLARMYGHLSIHKKNFEKLGESEKNEFIRHFDDLKERSEQLMILADADIEAYENVMKVYKMDKLDPKRCEMLHNASLQATLVPLSVMQTGIEGLRLCSEMTEHGNRNAVSDLAIGAILLYSAVESASLNILINLSSLHDHQKKEFQDEMEQLLAEGRRLREKILDETKKRISA